MTHLIYEAQMSIMFMQVQSVPANASQLTCAKPEIEMLC